MKNSLLLIGLFLLLLFTPTVFAVETCKDIYCYEFDYICCCVDDDQSADKWTTISQLQKHAPGGSMPPQCPNGIDIKECKIHLSVSKGLTVFKGYPECQEYTEKVGFLGLKTIKRWKCQNEEMIKVNEGSTPTITLNPGQMIYTWSWDTTSNDISISSGYTYKYNLRRTGRAGSCVGLDVSGAIGCGFNPEGSQYRIYNQNSKNYVNSDFELTDNECYRITSEGDKRKCGSTCDECKTDLDCANLYPNQYNLNEKTYGGYCQNGEIVLYGCVGTGKKVCMKYDDINKNHIREQNEKCYEENEKKKCGLVKRITTGIECCTSDDCQGVGDYYCNWIDDTHSKCELNAQCQRDSDCGTATKCDRQTMQIKEPYCDSEKQCSEKVLKKVECCKDSDCQGGFYCTSDYQCKETPAGTIYKRSSDRDLGIDSSSGITGEVIKPTKDSSTTGIIIGVLILLCICIGGAVYYFKSKTSTNEFVENVVNENTGKFCETCGAQLTNEDKFCTGCGTKV
ncbi:MAG: hypothetical protein KAT28_05470 [Candidatus Aenigmarchaeota archaeon]|nr:hypothetical protein [Candidatus Aenigmarchaeota archaeon]